MSPKIELFVTDQLPFTFGAAGSLTDQKRNRCSLLVIFATLGLHLGFSPKLRIWQVPTCKMEPRSGYIMQLEPPTQPPSPTDQFEISFSLQDGATKWLYYHTGSDKPLLLLLEALAPPIISPCSSDPPAAHLFF